jgi:prepilin-type N-terminal cleavage/methylation domain-containing protein
LSVSRAGFTLLEITIVMIIMGIALGVVGMLISKDRGSLEAKTFTKELSAVLRRARSNAVTEKKTYCFVIDKEERVFRLYTDKTKDKDDDGENGKFTVVTSKSIPEELEMIVQGDDSDFPFIEFFPQGNSTGGVLEISNEKGTTYFISVNMITGKLDVEKAE